MICELLFHTIVSPDSKNEKMIIHIPSHATFADLYQIIASIYGENATHKHQFILKQSRGFRRSGIEVLPEKDIEYYSATRTFYDEETEIISQWLTQLNDYVIFTNQTIRLTIKLVRRLRKQDEMYPQCVAIDVTNEKCEQMNPLTNRSPSDQITAQLHSITYTFSETNPITNIWPRLLHNVKQFYSLKPWTVMTDVTYTFAIFERTNKQFYFCVVLGGEDDSFGLAIYEGMDGYATFIELINSNKSMFELIRRMRGITLRFLERSELSDTQIDLIDTYDHSFREQSILPTFSSFKPGYGTWPLDEREMETLNVAIEQSMTIYDLLRTGNLAPNLYDEQQIYVCEFERSMFKKGSMYSMDDLLFSNYDTPLYITEFELKKLDKLTKRFDEILEFSIIHIDLPIQNHPYERPVYPTITLSYQYSKDVMAAYEFSAGSISPAYVQQQFARMLYSLNFIPKVIYIDELTFLKLLPLINQLANSLKVIEFEIYTKLPILDKIKAPFINDLNLSDEE